MARVVLVEASERLPGLFPLQAWEALRGAELVWARDPDTHPSAPYLTLFDTPLVRLEPAELDLRRLDLTEPGSVEDRRYARALLDLAEVEGKAVYLLGPPDGGSFTRVVGLQATKIAVEIEFVFHLEPPGAEVLRLAEVERRLRDPEAGCPWDLEQDHASLARYLVEETYELLDAIDAGDDEAIVEELGDVLLQVVFHAQVGADRGAFTIDEVARGIADKLVRRHPHVFEDVEVTGADEVVARWEVLKQQEKARTGPFEGVPSALPALLLAEKLQRRAAKLGFERWEAVAAADVVRAEADALARLEGDPDTREERLGELFSAAVGLSRHLHVDPERALRRATARFRRRFESAMAAATAEGLNLEALEPARWWRLWQAAEQGS
ncbi:MAG: nucleoside triphosphate pyrophosphohydrolase [Actinomycetota bacterium]|nr:nucleoside triphosphate pyrophosphohydrolase [Actinomycetota bacterium]